jgi:hypothetical protein
MVWTPPTYRHQFVEPYVKSNKNDVNNAEAICEAVARPSMRFVAIKTIVQQQDVTMLNGRVDDLDKQVLTPFLCDTSYSFRICASLSLNDYDGKVSI